MSDAITSFGFLFLGDPPQLDCEDAADTNDNGVLDIGHEINLLTFLFLGGGQPTADDVGCGEYRGVSVRDAAAGLLVDIARWSELRHLGSYLARRL